MGRAPTSLLSRRSRAVAALVLALIVVAPLMSGGFTLVYDMVFVPRPHFSAGLFGLSSVYPRTVPTQLFVAAASRLVSSAFLQRAALLFVFAGAAGGAARLVGTSTRTEGQARAATAGIAAGVLYAWNPFTYERLLLGQWALLLGYAILPWAVAAALTFRRGERGATWRLILLLGALAASSPYMGVIGGATTLAVALWPGDPGPGALADAGGLAARSIRDTALLLFGTIAVNLPWLVPTLLHPGAPAQPAVSVDLFAARSDSPLGTLGSLASLGGIWRTDLAPPGRSTIIWIPAFIIIASLAVLGWRRMTDGSWSRSARRGLLVCATLGLGLAIAPVVPGLHASVVWIVRTVPGGGFLRDSQKFAIPLALAEAVGFGFGVRSLVDRIPSADRLARRSALIVIALPVALAPTLAWAAGGRLHTASYPPSWQRAERVMTQDPAPGGVLVLPWHTYLPFAWNHEQTVHQPAGLYFTRPVLAASGLEVDGVKLPGEDPWSRMADPFVVSSGPLAPHLAELGVRYVVLFREGDLRPILPKLAGLKPVVQTTDLTLYRSAPAAIPTFPAPPAAPVVSCDLLAAGVIVLAAVRSIRRRDRSRVRSSDGAGQADSTVGESRRGT